MATFTAASVHRVEQLDGAPWENLSDPSRVTSRAFVQRMARLLACLLFSYALDAAHYATAAQTIAMTYMTLTE